MNNYGEYANADLGDARRGRRFAKLLSQLAKNAAASISAAIGNFHQAKAAYRFIGNDDVTVEAITQITREVTIANMLADKPDESGNEALTVLVAEDTTSVNYNGLKGTEGLGPLSNSKKALGIHVHSALAVSEEGGIYGLLSQKLWVRSVEEFGKTAANRRKPVEEKESCKWIETMENIERSLPENIKAVHICDREGDMYELFCKAEELQTRYLCRRRINRNTKDEDGMGKLDDFVQSLPVAVTIEIKVPRDSHTGRVARTAKVEVKHGKTRITKPDTLLRTNKGLPRTVEVYVVTVEEIGAPEGQEKILWNLITNVPAETVEEALTLIKWYTQRWKIETFHHTLKSGCKVEELQSEKAERLEKLIAIYSIIAVQIMHLTMIGRLMPDASCELLLGEEEWQLLYRVSNKTRQMPKEAPSVKEAVVMIARLGGFLARKSDGDPGTKVIWRGLTAFMTITEHAAYV